MIFAFCIFLAIGAVIYAIYVGLSAREIVATVVGFVVAAIIPAVALAASGPLDGTHHLGSIVISAAILYPFSAVFTVLLGLPAFLLLRPFRPGHWWSVSMVGLGLGALMAIALYWPGSADIRTFMLMCPSAALSALAFWLIWRHAAPQRGENGK